MKSVLQVQEKSLTRLTFMLHLYACNVHLKRTTAVRSRHHKIMAPMTKNFIGVLWILSRSAIKAMGLTAGRFKRGALRGYYLTCGWCLNKKPVLLNREGYISGLTYPASWHGLRPVQWLKAASPDNFHKRSQGEDTLYLIPHVSSTGGVNTKHHSCFLQVWNEPCCGHKGCFSVNGF